MSRLRLALALGAYAALLFLSAPAWPDDWDGVGFLESVVRFDLDHFQPHPPGYPVYVALLKLASLVASTPMHACLLVAVASGTTTAGFTWSVVRSRAGESAAWATAALVGASPLVWRAFSGVGSEAPALACAAACTWGLAVAARRPWAGAVALGVGAGLGLGVRLSWAPLYLAALALAPRGGRTKAWVSSLLLCTAWSVPLALVVGPAHLRALMVAQLTGHAQRWGGTMVTEPGAIRLRWLARDVFVDGLGAGSDLLGLAIGLAMVAVAAASLVAWRRARWRGWRPALVIVVPYLVWIAVGQNLRDQPRHALPVVALLAGGLAAMATGARTARVAVALLTTLVATRTALDAHARHTIAPPGAQLVTLARAQPAPGKLVVFGVSSVRFFEVAELGDVDGASTRAPVPRAFPAGSLGDVQVRLARLDALPSQVWVTGELQGLDGSPWPLQPVATLCRPPRIDRRASCLDVFSWKVPYLKP